MINLEQLEEDLREGRITQEEFDNAVRELMPPGPPAPPTTIED